MLQQDFLTYDALYLRRKHLAMYSEEKVDDS